MQFAFISIALLAANSPLSTLSPQPTDFLAESIDLPSNLISDDGLPFSRAVLEAMVADAVVWAAMHGLLVRSPSSSDDENSDDARLVHAPFALLPATFPAEQITLARDVLAPLFGTLVERVSRDVSWLAQTLRDAAAGDDFTKRLLKLCAQVQREGGSQQARLAILRSDYMLHEPEGSGVPGSCRLLQVELNTIAASDASLGSKVGELHSSLAQRWQSARRHAWVEAGKPNSLSLTRVLPPSHAVEEISSAMARAHGLYGKPDAVILFVVRPNERNAIDVEHLAEALWSARGIKVIRRTLSQIAHEARLVGPERKLHLSNNDEGRSGNGANGQDEVALVYFRAGYCPEDYPTKRQWDARTLLERSHSIKCPCIEHHLVGCKKVQQQLALPGELERFLSVEEATTLRAVFAGLWSLAGPAEPAADAPADEHVAAMHMRLAQERPSEYVMKPQREGMSDVRSGAHNLFGTELASALSTLSREQRAAYILMQRILPRRVHSVLVHNGKPSIGPASSELGIFSTLLTSSPGKVLLNKAAGHLVRTKRDGIDDAASAVLSSPLASGDSATAKSRSWWG